MRLDAAGKVLGASPGVCLYTRMHCTRDEGPPLARGALAEALARRPQLHTCKMERTDRREGCSSFRSLLLRNTTFCVQGRNIEVYASQDSPDAAARGGLWGKIGASETEIRVADPARPPDSQPEVNKTKFAR